MILFPKPKHKRRKPVRRKRNNFSKKAREQIIARDEGKCQQCGGFGREIHHVKYRSQGGRGVVTNGLLLCSTCHLMVHQDRNLTVKWQRHFESFYGKNYYKDEWDYE